MKRPPSPPRALGEVQAAAVRLAEALGWGVAVEAADGTRVVLRRGSPMRLVVICLAGGEPS